MYGKKWALASWQELIEAAQYHANKQRSIMLSADTRATSDLLKSHVTV
jgi:hypothetical protein